MGGGTVKMCILNRFAGRSATRRLFLILVLYVSVALAYGLVTPVYEGPDELGHVLYVKHIAEGRGIPVQSREYAIAYGFGQEGSQAPLYYALNAALVRVLGLSVDDLEGVPEINPFTTCGRPRWRDNVAFYRHDPRLETFPYQGAARAVHVMRLLSVLLGGMTVRRGCRPGMRRLGRHRPQGASRGGLGSAFLRLRKAVGSDRRRPQE